MTNLFDIYSVPDEERGDDIVNQAGVGVGVLNLGRYIYIYIDIWIEFEPDDVIAH